MNDGVILESVILGGAVIATFCLLGAVSFLVMIIFNRQGLVTNGAKKSKETSRQKRRRKKQQALLKRTQHSRWHRSFLLFALSVIFATSAGYARYYQAMHLSQNDGDQVAKSYYLVRDFETTLTASKALKEPDKVTQERFRQLSTRMASYGIQKSDTRNSEEGQLLLNRYYASLTQLGKNASQQVTKLYGESDKIGSLLSDSEKTKLYEKEVLDYYRVDEKKLKQQEKQ